MEERGWRRGGVELRVINIDLFKHKSTKFKIF